MTLKCERKPWFAFCLEWNNRFSYPGIPGLSLLLIFGVQHHQQLVWRILWKGTTNDIFILKRSRMKKKTNLQTSSVDRYSVLAMSLCKRKLFKSVSLSKVEVGLFSSPADERPGINSIFSSRVCVQLWSILARATTPCPHTERFTRGQHAITFYCKSRSSPCQLSKSFFEISCLLFHSYDCK